MYDVVAGEAVTEIDDVVTPRRTRTTGATRLTFEWISPGGTFGEIAGPYDE